jgi:flagellar biosynthesis/type III secretory pathway ATPase
MQQQSNQLKPKIMGVDVMKQQLIDRIQNGDEQYIRVLLAVSNALDESAQKEEITDEMIMAIPPDPTMKRLTEEELLTRLEASSAQVERGEYVTIEELEKEMEEW